MRWHLSAVLTSIFYLSLCTASSNVFAINESHSFGTLFNKESKKDTNKKPVKKTQAKISEAKQTFGTLLDPTKKKQEEAKIKSSNGFGSLIDQKQKPKKVADKEDKNIDLLRSILNTLKNPPKPAPSGIAKQENLNADIKESAKVNPADQRFELADGTQKRKPSLQLSFGSGWVHADGNGAVDALNISKLNRAYSEFGLKWWGILGVLGPDLGASAYYYTPTMFRPKICGNNPCTTVLDINVNNYGALLMYRLVKPYLELIPEAGYNFYSFRIPTSQQFVVDHSFQGPSLGAKFRAPIWGKDWNVSILGECLVTVGNFSQNGGKSIANLGGELHATAVYAELGVGWKFSKNIHFDAVWQNETYWFDFQSGDSRSSYWNMGARIVVEFPFVSFIN